ncbi:Pentatricopeptide repeat (PPR) superfamily protein [Zea mays]|uniref:Pentatricopeptide repeat (PPR) superfamily protein n=1 Tax=Zea mays TaxID=4577 RepID=A0A1D6QI53_MAIZE|nr:Pentatricopeptide repeat (PPR) superfamily protein [Zea mays]
MLPAAATAAAPDPSCSTFPSSRRAPPVASRHSFVVATRATGSSGLFSLRCHGRLPCHSRCRCRCRAWWNNERARRVSGASRGRHCRAVASAPDHMDEQPARGRYHPFEEISEAVQLDDGEPAHLTDAESARTIVEVNNKATVMISTLVGDGVHERIILPEFPYLTDENGDIYFEVDNEDALLESIMGEDKIAHVIIGLDNTQVFADLDLVSASATEFAQEDDNGDEDDDGSDDDEESDFDEDFNDVEGVFSVDEDDEDDREEEEEEDDDDDDEDLPSWSNLETVNSCHPLYFARMIVETATKSSIDWLDRPPASLVVEGQLRPAFAEESTMVAKHISSITAVNELKPDQPPCIQQMSAFYESMRFLQQPKVKIEEYQKAKPDIIAHSAPNVISRLRAGGDKVTQALKSLCWRSKAIQVEEAAVIGVDCLGFDLRVCSGTQVQTLRFAFPTKATSEFSAEKQIHELLFPRNTHQEGQSPQARQKS